MKKKIILMSIFTALFVFMGVYINELNSYLYSAIGIVSGWAFVFISKQNLELRAENTSLLAQLDTLKEMYNTEVECNIKQRDKIDSLKLEIDEKYQELSLLRQKYSRTNQPRSGGKFVKKSMKIEQVCLENLELVVTNDGGYVGNICGYDRGCEIGDSMEFIIGMDDDRGWKGLQLDDIILKEYPYYKYCNYQDILKAKSKML